MKENVEESPPPAIDKDKERAKTLRSWAGSIKYLVLLAFIGLLIPTIIYQYNSKNKIIHSDKRSSCVQTEFPYQESQKMVFVSSISNYSSLVSETDFTTLNLYQRLSTFDAGQPVWVSDQNELWIPDIGNNLIYIYEILTWRKIATLDTSLNNCTAPTHADYHPLAGPVGEGQVWLSCAAGWIVYHPPTRQFVTFIPVPLALAGYTPYHVAVGQYYTALSVQNTSATSVYSLIQYDNRAFTLNILSSLYGTNCILSYLHTADSALYVSSSLTSKIYKVNFTDLSLITSWSQASVVDITTDMTGRYLFALDSSSIVTRYTTSPPTYPVYGSTLFLQYPSANKILISSDNNYLYAAYNNIKTATVNLIDPNNMFPIGENIHVNVANSSRYITNIAISCPCALC